MIQSTIDLIISIIIKNIDIDNFSLEQADENLSEIGMDSIKFIQIVVALEDEFNIEIPDEYLITANMGTLRKMVEVVSVEINKNCLTY